MRLFLILAFILLCGCQKPTGAITENNLPKRISKNKYSSIEKVEINNGIVRVYWKDVNKINYDELKTLMKEIEGMK